ncbi:DUF596 domain-containing protein [Stenotrophomonas sp. PS02289]|uniref:DUF596 domain-containing protein n=1 Tax=Stenotrophomonas sp. PS02289 TaxID=2991422 RepID=UPI00249BFEAA|nr:DUF596 domain-containing protein [Stenotrophomonas sp. PS02289]
MTDDQLSLLLGEVGMCGVDGIWYKTYDFHPDLEFQKRIEVFLQVLSAILERGLAKLQSADQMLSAPIEEQVSQFRVAWPSEDDWDEDFFWASKSGIGWTPSGLVWIAAGGSEFWT